MRPENFIFFLTACGFFIGLIFALAADLEPMDIVWASALVTIIFYMLGLCAGAFFIRYVNVKAAYTIDTNYYETQLDKAKSQIERREANIRDAAMFIRTLEEEIASSAKDDDKAAR